MISTRAGSLGRMSRMPEPPQLVQCPTEALIGTHVAGGNVVELCFWSPRGGTPVFTVRHNYERTSRAMAAEASPSFAVASSPPTLTALATQWAM